MLCGCGGRRAMKLTSLPLFCYAEAGVSRLQLRMALEITPQRFQTPELGGVQVCPKAVIVVAADIPADALTASVLSDPTGLSHEPYLRRSAAADPLFRPGGRLP